MCQCLCFYFFCFCITCVFFFDTDCFQQIIISVFFYSCFDFFRNHFQFRYHFFFCQFQSQSFCTEFFNCCNDFFDFFMTEHDCVQNGCFRHFFCTGFYHHNSICSTCNSQMHQALFFLFLIWVDDKFTIYQTYYYTCNWARSPPKPGPPAPSNHQAWTSRP